MIPSSCSYAPASAPKVFPCLLFAAERLGSWPSWLRISFAASLIAIGTSTSFFAAEIQPGNCARAAGYSDKNGGFSMLVMQNGKTVFEHYANGGGANMRCKIFSGTKSFWGIAALCAVRDGL